MTPLPPELRASVLASARAEPSPDMRSRRRMNLAGVALGVVTAGVMLGIAGVTLGGRPLAFVVLSAAGWAALAGVATAVGARGRSMLGRAGPLLVVTAAALAPAIFGWLMACSSGWGWPGLGGPAGTAAQTLGCFAVTSLLSLGPVIALSLVRRGLDPVHPRATGAVAFAAAAAWGGVLIDLHCPLTHPAHVALGHVLPVVLSGFVGASLGERLFGVRE